jgi:hypothetical protein
MRARQRHFNARDSGAGFVFDSRYINQSDNTAVSTWSDRSRNGWDAAQNTGNQQPLFRISQFGGNGVVRFDGSNDGLNISGALPLLNNVNGATLLSVVKYSANNTGNSIFFANNGTATRARLASGYEAGGRRLDGDGFFAIVGGSYSSTRILIHTGVFDYSNSDLFLFLDGKQESQQLNFSTNGNSSATNSGSVTLGNNTISQALNGDMGQALAFNFALHSSLRKRLEHAAAFSFKIACN